MTPKPPNDTDRAPAESRIPDQDSFRCVVSVHSVYSVANRFRSCFLKPELSSDSMARLAPSAPSWVLDASFLAQSSLLGVARAVVLTTLETHREGVEQVPIGRRAKPKRDATIRLRRADTAQLGYGLDTYC